MTRTYLPYLCSISMSQLRGGVGRVRPTGQPPLLSYRLLGATPSSAVQRAGTRRSQGGGEGRHNTVSVVTGVGTQQHCSRHSRLYRNIC